MSTLPVSEVEWGITRFGSTDGDWPASSGFGVVLPDVEGVGELLLTTVPGGMTLVDEGGRLVEGTWMLMVE